jgi:cellobiose-specific phosphotransferase system component IIA
MSIEETNNNTELTLEETCFQIIAFSGDALSTLINALKLCRKNDYAKAEKLIDEASNMLNKAHNIHTQLLANEAKGQNINYSVLLTHAQDNMMNTILAKTLVEEMIEMYKSLKRIEQ